MDQGLIAAMMIFNTAQVNSASQFLETYVEPSNVRSASSDDGSDFIDGFYLYTQYSNRIFASNGSGYFYCDINIQKQNISWHNTWWEGRAFVNGGMRTYANLGWMPEAIYDN